MTPKRQNVKAPKRTGVIPASTPHLHKLIDASLAMRENPDAYERAYMARQLVQCTLPHSDPGNVPVWSRTNGDLTLAVRPYVDPKTRKALYPYGTIPRLLLFWMVTEATQTKSNRIELGNSLDEFIRAIGLNPRTGGGKRSDAKRLHSQMTRLFRAVISFEDRWPGGISYVDMQIAPRGMLWWSPKKSGETTLMENWVELGEDFYKAITAAPVPVDLRALRALKRSPLALDLYALLAYRTWTVNRKRAAASIPWEGLHAQMGGEYTRLRDFKTKVIEALRRIRLVYPDVRVETTPEGLTIHPAKTPIPAKNTVDGIR